MKPKHEERKKLNVEPAKKTLIYFVGKNKFNNEILADFLREHTGIESRCINSYCIGKVVEKLSNAINLIFLDYTGFEHLTLMERADIDKVLKYQNCLSILFRANPKCQLEYAALNKGMRGIIYRNQPIDVFPKVVHVILNGELWYPRKVLEQHFAAKDDPADIRDNGWQTLTAREKEILRLLALGKKNKEIANNFFISHHTVKTHVYNIFKKLKVKNRLQASLKQSSRRDRTGFP